jgi:hypothetical protein
MKKTLVCFLTGLVCLTVWAKDVSVTVSDGDIGMPLEGAKITVAEQAGKTGRVRRSRP